MALGWHIAGDGITRWHNGMTGGYHTWISVIPDRGIAVVVLANTATYKVSQFGEVVTRVAAGGPAPAPKRLPKVVEVDPKVLNGYVGTYVMTPQFSLTVTQADDGLWVQATGQDKFRIYPSSPTEFFYKVVDARITFVVDDAGRAGKLILHQNGRDMPATRRE